jgi:four helix bundle protein
MNATELQERTMLFAIRVLRFSEALPKTTTGRTIAQQAARSGTSVAANYRAARRCKSRNDFVNKITIVLEEADETEFWIELAQRLKLLPQEKLAALRDEAGQLTRIFNATRRTAKNRES